MTKKPNPDAQRFADKAIAHVQRSRGFVSETVMEYMAMGMLAEQMAHADVSIDVSGLDAELLEKASQQRKGRVFDIYVEAIAIVHAHFNQVEA